MTQTATRPSSLAPRPLPPRRQWPRLLGSRGWIGVDVGAAGIKMAQIEQRADGWQIAARWLIPVSSERGSNHPAGLLQDFAGLLPQIALSRAAFRGRSAAVTSPLSATEYRCFELPRGSREELRQMIEGELQIEQGADGHAARCFDFWELAGADLSDSHMTQVAVVDVSQETALELSAGLRTAGLDCRVLDGLPCALARALQLADPNCVDVPTAAIDLGESAAVLVIARQGRPQITRVLRGCGMTTLLKPLEEGLKRSRSESRQLLSRIGVPLAAKTGGPDAAARATLELLAGPLGRLTAEIKRTLSYWENSCRSPTPHELVLFGGGSLVRHLPELIAAETGVPTRKWRLRESEASHAHWDDALFGVAAALSALAWETRSCM